MKTSFKALFVGTALVGAILSGCKEDDHDHVHTEGLELIGTAFTDAGGIQVKLWAEGPVQAQYTRFFIELRDSATNELIDDAHVHLSPMMDMGNMVHSAPFEEPATALAVNGLFPCAVVFQMPGAMGWTLGVSVHNHHNDAEGTATFAFAVAAPAVTRTHVVTELNSSNKLIISFVQPKTPVVGINDFEVTLHSMASMMSFPAVTNYTVHIEPTMPSMGHGSPNNVNPTHTGNGHYVGKVNFTMTGTWRIDLTVLNGNDTVYSDAYFDVTF
jgi:hypothetical protein